MKEMFKDVEYENLYKRKTGRKFFIPVLLSIADVACKMDNFVFKKVDKHIDAQTKEILDCTDFDELARNLKHLKGYKGLKMLGGKSQESDEVTIIL